MDNNRDEYTGGDSNNPHDPHAEEFARLADMIGGSLGILGDALLNRVDGTEPHRYVDIIRRLLLEVATDYEPLHEGVINLRMLLGRALWLSGLAEEAEPILRAAMEDAEAASGCTTRLWFSCVGNLSRALGRMGRVQEALVLARDLHRRRTAEFGRNDPGTLNTLAHIADLCMLLGDHEGAVRAYRAQHRGRRRILGADSVATRRSAHNLALATAMRDRDVTALAALVEELGTVEGADHPYVTELRGHLAGLLETTGDEAAALAEWARIARTHLDTVGEVAEPTLVAMIRRLRLEARAGRPGAERELAATGRALAMVAGRTHLALRYCTPDA
ncbi:MAG: tetratricopeptide repeat protein [Acidimicrobiales bacterium]